MGILDAQDRRVALLAEGVDRNLLAMMVMVPSLVALLAEGVDRNFPRPRPRRVDVTVALLAEGVDRNTVSKASATST